MDSVVVTDPNNPKALDTWWLLIGRTPEIDLPLNQSSVIQRFGPQETIAGQVHDFSSDGHFALPMPLQ